MKMIYTIITAPSDDKLCDRVNKEMESGWVCQGGVYRDIQGATYYQAMVKLEENKK